MIRLVAVLTGLVLIAAVADGGAQAPPVKIGVLLPYTGPLSVQGNDATRGLELYLARSGGRAGGRQLQLLKEDTEAKPDVGLTKVKKLVERDRVDFLVGPVNSVVALAIRNYVHEQGTPLVVPVAFTRVLTAPPLVSPAIFRVVETSDQANYPMGAWMMKHTRYRKVVVMATDFVAGHHAVEAFMAGFRAAGGEIVKEIFAPLGTPDFAPYLAQAGAQNADAVYAFFPGADAIRFVKQWKEFGLGERMGLTGHNVLTDDTILPALSDAALGILTIGGYTAVLDTPENKAFVRDYEQAYKGWPTRYSEAGWVSAALVSAAVEALQGDLGDRTRVREALRAALPKIKAPAGPMTFDQHRQVIRPIYIMQTEKQGGRIVNAIRERIPNVSQEATWGWWNKKP
ncbi:MAG: ABC transporter substrate-binding protein [Candidatus Rokuibacteriota bacterium]